MMIKITEVITTSLRNEIFNFCETAAVRLMRARHCGFTPDSVKFSKRTNAHCKLCKLELSRGQSHQNE